MVTEGVPKYSTTKLEHKEQVNSRCDGAEKG